VGKTKTAIIWDMDGVIVDSAPFHFAAWEEIFSERRAKFTREDFIPLFGSRNDFIIRNVLGQDVPEKDVKSIAREKERKFRARIKGETALLPGVSRMLNTLKGSFKMALATSAPRENIRLILGELNIGEYFDCVVSGHEVAKSKPSPEIYSLAARRLKADPKNCIVIEDSPLGVKAALAAGMKCLAVSNSHPEQDLAEASAVVNSLEDMGPTTLSSMVWKG
jgi:beta-phosphoglucomutase